MSLEAYRQTAQSDCFLFFLSNILSLSLSLLSCFNSFFQPGSPADDMRKMLVRRMSQRNRSEQERIVREASQEAKEAPTPTTATTELKKQLAEKDTAMLDLQRRVEGGFN